MSNDLVRRVADVLKKNNNKVFEAQNIKEAEDINTKEKADLIIIVIGNKIIGVSPKHIKTLPLLLADESLIC